MTKAFIKPTTRNGLSNNMLIGLHSDKVTDKVLSNIVATIGEDTRIFEPDSPEGMLEAIREMDGFTSSMVTRKGKPKKRGNLILIKTHYDFFKDDITSFKYWDWGFDRYGGAVWGEDGSIDAQTHQADTLDDPVSMVAMGMWGDQRRQMMRTIAPKYIGRVTSDPHTICVGYSNSFPQSSSAWKFLTRSIPTTSNWWHGVGFFRANIKELTPKFLDQYGDDVNFVAIGENADNFLTEHGIEHGTVPKPVTKIYRNPLSSDPYGRLIRTVSTSKENRLDWLPPTQ